MFAYVSDSVAPRCRPTAERWARRSFEHLRFTPAGVGAASSRRSWRRSARDPARARPRARAARVGAGWRSAASVYLAAPRRASAPPSRVGGDRRDARAGTSAMFETEDGRPRDLGAAGRADARARVARAVALDAPSPLVCLSRPPRPTRSTGRPRGARADAGGPRPRTASSTPAVTAAALRGARRHGSLGRAPVAGELARIGAGLAYAVGVWFGRAPSRRPTALLHAARWSTALRVGRPRDGRPRRRRPARRRAAARAARLSASPLLGRAVAASSRAASPSRASSSDPVVRLEAAALGAGDIAIDHERCHSRRARPRRSRAAPTSQPGVAREPLGQAELLVQRLREPPDERSRRSAHGDGHVPHGVALARADAAEATDRGRDRLRVLRAQSAAARARPLPAARPCPPAAARST